MKISIITQHAVNNYGSLLQTYATQRVFEKMGHTAQIVDFRRESDLDETKIDHAFARNRLLKKTEPIWGICTLTRRLARRAVGAKLLGSRKRLREFLQNEINLTPEMYTSFESLCARPPIADIYVTGSDQVWNSAHNGGIERSYFLEFAPEDKPRISFASSIGQTELSEAEREELGAMLSKYRAVSVREKSAEELLRGMGIEAQTVLDPTLMLSPEEWREFADFGKCPKKPYLLIYQLNENPEFERRARQIASDRGLRIVRISYHSSDKKKIGKRISRPTPHEFVGLFAKAEVCLTDSFHATAFSLNLGADPVCIMPPRFSTRLESLLNMTGTAYRAVASASEALPEKAVDRRKVAEILNSERELSFRFLENALNLN